MRPAKPEPLVATTRKCRAVQTTSERAAEVGGAEAPPTRPWVARVTRTETSSDQNKPRSPFEVRSGAGPHAVS